MFTIQFTEIAFFIFTERHWSHETLLFKIRFFLVSWFDLTGWQAFKSPFKAMLMMRGCEKERHCYKAAVP